MKLASGLTKVLPLGAFTEIGTYVCFLWMPIYLVQFLNIPSKIAQFYNTVTLVAWAAFTLITGYLSSVFGYKRLIITHILAVVFLSYPLFKGLYGASYGIFLAFI